MNKRSKYIVPLLALALTAASCSKNKKHCWGCLVVFYKAQSTAYNDTMICNKSRAEINAIKSRQYDGSAQGYIAYEIKNCSKL